MRAIKGIIDAKGPTAERSPRRPSDAEAFVNISPAGLDKCGTEALPVVGTDSEGFEAASKNAEAAFDKLSVAAGSGDMAALTAAFTDAGKACGACHDKFRAKAN